MVRIMNKMEFAVIGGDMRQTKLAELLSADGHKVSVFALDKAEPKGSFASASIAQAVMNAQCIVLPLPIVSKDGTLNTPLSSGVYTLDNVFNVLNRNQLIAAGRIDENTYKLASSYGLSMWDYYAREELVVSNAVATAEGAIQIAMEETAITLLSCKTLIIGYGRIGKILAHRMHALGVDTYVSARNHADVAWIEAYGYKPLFTDKLEGHLNSFDLIINTVPARVLGETRLKEVSKDCLIIDLSSKPGGMDFIAASNLGLKAIWALSLPGEVAPVTSGVIIKNTIYNIIHEQSNIDSDISETDIDSQLDKFQ